MHFRTSNIWVLLVATLAFCEAHLTIPPRDSPSSLDSHDTVHFENLTELVRTPTEGQDTTAAHALSRRNDLQPLCLGYDNGIYINWVINIDQRTILSYYRDAWIFGDRQTAINQLNLMLTRYHPFMSEDFEASLTGVVDSDQGNGIILYINTRTNLRPGGMLRFLVQGIANLQFSQNMHLARVWPCRTIRVPGQIGAGQSDEEKSPQQRCVDLCREEAPLQDCNRFKPRYPNTECDLRWLRDPGYPPHDQACYMCRVVAKEGVMISQPVQDWDTSGFRVFGGASIVVSYTTVLDAKLLKDTTTDELERQVFPGPS